MVMPAKHPPYPDLRRIRRALLSVSDKTGLVDLASSLSHRGVELISTGGTAQLLRDAKLPVKDVSEITKFPEIFGGRVKTLHPAIHGGLLGIVDDPAHSLAMHEYQIEPFDLLVVNLYPFAETVSKGSQTPVIIENIDIGGPAMLRAAAKNHAYVAVVSDSDDYPRLLAELDKYDGSLPLAFRRELAAKTFARTAAYDATIANWFAEELEIQTPTWVTISAELQTPLRYGENPHQKAAFYRTNERRYGVSTAQLLQGKELSYNNINDTDAAFELVAEFDAAQASAVAIIKHANPCGVAKGRSLREAYEKALMCDPLSAFGGIVALNQSLDEECAQEIIKTFTEVVVAPGATAAARQVLSRKKNLRLLVTGGMPDPNVRGHNVRTVAGGLLVQARDNCVIDTSRLHVVSKRQPTEQEFSDLLFAFTVAKHVKSNAIVYAKNNATVAIGAGQMSRIDSSRIAAKKAEDAASAAGFTQALTMGSVVASDAFFPFADGLLAAVDAGATAVIQPGGSIRDEEVIAAADDRDIAMIFTDIRHFRH